MRKYKGESLTDFVDTYTIIDIETTGLSPVHDEIIELAAIRIEKKEIIDTFSCLTKPSCKISEFISSLTGITNEMLTSAFELGSILPAYLDFIGDNILVGHNIHFDINFIYDNSLKLLNQPLRNDFVDTLRLSRRLMKSLDNHKLSTIAKVFGIDCNHSHRALNDCKTTFNCFEFMRTLNNDYYNTIADNIIESLKIKNKYNQIYNMFNSKRVSVKGSFLHIDSNTLFSILKKLGAKPSCNLYKSCEFIITSNRKAESYNYENNLTIINEDEFYKIFDIPVKEKNIYDYMKNSNVKLSDIVANPDNCNINNPLYNKACVFTGALEKMSRQQAMQIVANIGGICSNSVTKKTNFLILGNFDYCRMIKDNKSGKTKKAEEYILKGQDISIISENEFYEMIEIELIGEIK